MGIVGKKPAQNGGFLHAINESEDQRDTVIVLMLKKERAPQDDGVAGRNMVFPHPLLSSARLDRATQYAAAFRFHYQRQKPRKILTLSG
jgi:hypothetical protein